MIILDSFIGHFITIACILTGINIVWGFFTARQIRAVAEYNEENGERAYITLNYTKYVMIGLMVTSTILFLILLIGTIFDWSLIIESLLVYNTFHTCLLAIVNIDLLKFWLTESERRR